MTVFYQHMLRDLLCASVHLSLVTAQLLREAAILRERNTGSLVLNEEKVLYLDIVRI